MLHTVKLSQVMQDNAESPTYSIPCYLVVAHITLLCRFGDKTFVHFADKNIVVTETVEEILELANGPAKTKAPKRMNKSQEQNIMLLNSNNGKKQ